MKVIKDIRVYRSQIENIDGNPMPNSFGNKMLNIILHRIAMKLRENEFTMGDFDHLYINLTTYEVESRIALSKRKIDRYHPWYRYYDVKIDQNLFDALETSQCIHLVTEFTEQVLQKCFGTPIFSNELIHLCVYEAVTQGENMLMKFKEKRSTKNRAVIFLRYLDNGRFYPLLRVWDSDNNLILEKDLPESDELYAYGEIQLSTKKITIKPRKNYFAKNQEPISFIL